eukprot:Em0006g615a
MPTDVKRRSKLLLSDSMYVEYLFELEDYSSVKQNKKQQRKKQQTNKSGINFSLIDHCYNFTNELFLAANSTRSLLSLISVLISIPVIALRIAQCYKRSDLIKHTDRLMVYACIATTLYASVESIQFVRIWNWDVACTVVGMFVEYTSVSVLVITACIGGHLMVLIWQTRCMKRAPDNTDKYKRHEVIYVFLTFLLPLLFIPWPFIHASYGQSGAFCWISFANDDCKPDWNHLVITIMLYYVWMVMVGPFTLVVAVTVVATLCLHVETSSLLVTSEALPGQTVTLRCLVTSFPPDLIYTWYRGGAMIAGQSSSVYSVANFSQSSAGNYTCKASGTYASVQVVFGVALLTPPVIQKVNTTFVTVGNTLQLTCTADSVHLPSYSWRSGNQSITNTSRVTVSVGGSRSGQLLVRQVVYNDSGVYTCVATNSIGRDTADFPVVVQGPPHVSVPGGGVVITPEGSTPLTGLLVDRLSNPIGHLDHDRGWGCVHSVQVQQSISGDSGIGQNVTFPGNSTTGKVWGLSAGSTYWLRLKAVKLGVQELLGTKSWPPPPPQGACPFRRVNVTVLLNGSVVQTLTVQPSWGESCLVSGLMPTTSYTIEVAASNAVGVTSVASSIITPLAVKVRSLNASINDSSVVQYSSDVTTTSLGISLLIEDVEGHLKPYEISHLQWRHRVVGTGPFSEPTDPASLVEALVASFCLIIGALSVRAAVRLCKDSRRRRELSEKVWGYYEMTMLVVDVTFAQ